MSPNQRLSFEQYTQAAEALHVLSGILLYEFVRRDDAPSLRDQIARNFIARADTLVEGIFRLWEIDDGADCWTLHRTLLDRLFHLHDINQNNQFEVFDDWSLKALYEAANRLRSDPALKGKTDGLLATGGTHPRAKNRYSFLCCCLHYFLSLESFLALLAWTSTGTPQEQLVTVRLYAQQSCYVSHFCSVGDCSTNSTSKD